MKIKCMIVDDEPLAIKVLEKYISELPYLHLIDSFHQAIKASEALQKQAVDLLFVDINMPKISGISLVKSLPDPPLVIFTTAYPEYAVEGFELEALDYLLKPFSFERFLKAVNKAVKELETANKLQQADRVKTGGTLMIKADRKLYPLPYDQILYLQAFGDYVKIFTKEKLYLPKETLQNLEKSLPQSQFIRVHRSYLVALDAIQYIEGNHLTINDQMIPIGQSYRDHLLQQLSTD